MAEESGLNKEVILGLTVVVVIIVVLAFLDLTRDRTTEVSTKIPKTFRYKICEETYIDGNTGSESSWHYVMPFDDEVKYKRHCVEYKIQEVNNPLTIY